MFQVQNIIMMTITVMIHHYDYDDGQDYGSDSDSDYDDDYESEDDQACDDDYEYD